jgi:hypothetical protein
MPFFFVKGCPNIYNTFDHWIALIQKGSQLNPFMQTNSSKSTKTFPKTARPALNQGDQMLLWNKSPKCSPTCSFIVHNFCRVKK